MALVLLLLVSGNARAAGAPPQCGGSFQLLHVEVGDPPVGAGSCFDDEGDDLTITITSRRMKGTAEVVNQGTPFASVPLRYAATSVGADSFKFRASDGSSDSNEVTVTTDNVAAVNDPPQCSGRSSCTGRGGRPPVHAGSCFDDEGDDLTITITSRRRRARPRSSTRARRSRRSATAPARWVRTASSSGPTTAARTRTR